LHVKAEFVGPDTYDSKAEHEQFQDALRQMPTGILISASAPNLLNSDIDAATLGPAEEQQPNKR
jgi:ABC-type sugar transport system substrate-binding protein